MNYDNNFYVVRVTTQEDETVTRIMSEIQFNSFVEERGLMHKFKRVEVTAFPSNIPVIEEGEE